jgi:hypothetical protein
MSYRERQTRKMRKGKTPEQLRKAMPDVYGPSRRLAIAAVADTYRIGPDGERILVRSDPVAFPWQLTGLAEIDA